MIKYLKQYEGKSFEELVNSLIWFDNPFKLKAIFAKINTLFTTVENLESGSIQSITGDFVDNTDPQNPILDRGYKVYTALLNQESTNAPTATILENNLGGIIVWSYIGVGQYIGVLTGAFDDTKTHLSITTSDLTGLFEIFVVDVDTIQVATVNATTNVAANDLLTNTSMEIRVYN